MVRRFGFNLLADQIADHLASEWEWMIDEKNNVYMVGETPIEKLLMTALETRCLLGVCEITRLDRALDNEHFESVKRFDVKELRIILRPQVKLQNRLVDFVVHAQSFTQDDLKKHDGWRPLLIECDGHDYHERTKEQAARDRSKDREATLAGLDTMRFTGSEIWRDPWGCASQITDWAVKVTLCL